MRVNTRYINSSRSTSSKKTMVPTPWYISVLHFRHAQHADKPRHKMELMFYSRRTHCSGSDKGSKGQLLTFPGPLPFLSQPPLLLQPLLLLPPPPLLLLLRLLPLLLLLGFAQNALLQRHGPGEGHFPTSHTAAQQ